MAKSPRRRPDHRPVKIHRTYTIEETATVLDVHKNTVRAWIRKGLPLTERKRPFLIHGADLVAYLKRRHAENKRPCGPGQIYCFPCRLVTRPAGDMVDYSAETATRGVLIGLCPRCERFIYRRVSRARLDEICGNLDVRITKPHTRIGDSACPLVNSDFMQETHDAV